MLNWKTFRYSLLHVLIVFMLFQRLFRKPNGGKWMLAFMVLIGIVSFQWNICLTERQAVRSKKHGV